MSYLGQKNTTQSLNGVLELTDGVITISDGKISNIQNLDVADALIENNLEVFGNATIDGILTASQFKLNGNLDMSMNNVINLANGVNANDAVNVSQLNLKADTTYVDTQDNLKLNLTGGRLSGVLDMSLNQIQRLANGIIATDAVNYGQLASKANTTYVNAQDALRLNLTGGTMSGIIDMSLNKIQRLADGTISSDAVNKSQLDLKGDLSYIDGSLNLKMNKTGGGFTDAITITETTGTLATATKGTITLDHQDSGGGTSIVFKSKVNAGSDFGYIQYKDTTGSAGTELSQLTIGTENDATGSVEDNINFKNAGVERFKIGGSGVLSASSFSIPFRCITGRLNNNSTIGSPASQTFDFASFTTTTDMILATFSSGVGYIYCNITTGSGSDAGDINIRLIEMTSGTDVILKNYYIYFGRNYDLTTSWETVMKNLNVPNNNTATTYSGHPPFILTKNRTFRFQISISRNTDDQYVVKWTDCYTCFFPVDSPNNI